MMSMMRMALRHNGKMRCDDLESPPLHTGEDKSDKHAKQKTSKGTQRTAWGKTCGVVFQ